MHKSRIEAFSDGVMAIILTIMVLELKVPHGAQLGDLLPLWPVFASYILSFIYLAIYWNNHHHLFQAVHHVNGPILWANLHLLFWLSLTPFVTAWAGENQFMPMPVACYGFVLLMAAIAYYILVRALMNHEGANSVVAKAVGSDFKGVISVVIYAVGVIVANYWPTIALFSYILVALIWLVPDRRIERALSSGPKSSRGN